MTNDDLNIIYLIPVDLLSITFYAALPLTVLAEETVRSVHNSGSHLLTGTVNNDLLYNTKLFGADHCICIWTDRENLSKRKKTAILIPMLGGSRMALLIEITGLQILGSYSGSSKAEARPWV